MTGKKMRRTAAVLAAAMVIGPLIPSAAIRNSASLAFAETAASGAGGTKKDSVSASTIRLAGTEGEVTVTAGGKELGILEEMKLHSGYTVKTGEKSYAGISLDSEKAAKLDALSSAQVRKQGKKLELLLNEGSLFCDVKQPLEADETLQIRTSTMITGIRGTVLYVKVIDEYTTMVYMLEGSASVLGRNSVTGDTERMEISAGQCAVVMAEGAEGSAAGSENGSALPPVILLNTFGVTDIPGYILTEAADDPALAARLEAAGWDTQWMADHAAERLAEDEAEAAKQLKRVKEAEESRQKTYRDYVYGDSGGGDSGSGQEEGTDSVRNTVILDQIVPASRLNELLQDSDVIINIPYRPGDDGTELPGDSNITVPAGGVLEISEAVLLRMEPGTTLTVDGALKAGGSLYCEGVLYNRSSNTLEVNHDLVIRGKLENTGAIRVGGMLSLEDGEFTSQGGRIEIEDQLTIYRSPSGSGDSAEDQTGEGQSLYLLDETMTVGGEVCLDSVDLRISGGTYESGIIARASRIEMTGGTVSAGADGYGITGESESRIRLLGGIVYGAGGAAAVNLSSSELYLAADVLRTDDGSARFVTGTGSLELNVNGESHVYDMENLPEGILNGVETEDGWAIDVFTGAEKKAEEKQQRQMGMATPSTAALPEDRIPGATPSSALRNQRQEECNGS
ncbi:FecR family protein [Hungatella effluvii]|uniref:FecR family protein n=1 Tax=Hungatella effluvii TaxID=1096246 RepID=A0A2V3Y9U7_9FIRM|nr:FecR domain-containing protein [Hungatella effluvii]PXX54978.1 FecR family protein [Hungatella effluvii]